MANPATVCGGCGAHPGRMHHVSGHRWRCIDCGLSYLAAADGTQLDHKQFTPGEGEGLNVPPLAKPLHKPGAFTGEPRTSPHINARERKVGWAQRAYPDQAGPEQSASIAPLAPPPPEAVAVRDAVNAERQAIHDLCLAIDSGRGNEKEIASAILRRTN